MALKKVISLPSGHTCEYWRIVRVQQDFATGAGTVIIAGYLDEQARLDGKQPSSDALVALEGYTGHGGTEQAYQWAKQQPQQIPGHVERITETVMMPGPVTPMPGNENAPTPPPPVAQEITREVWVPATQGPPLFADAEDC